MMSIMMIRLISAIALIALGAISYKVMSWLDGVMDGR